MIRLIDFLKGLMDVLDTNGGHVCVLLAMVSVGIGSVKSGIPEGKDILIGSFGALLAYLTIKKATGGPA